jgi:uncharacterized membrane protein
VTLPRALDATALVLAAGALAVIATGGVKPLTRPEDFVVATAVVVGVRALIAPFALPRVAVTRAVGVGVALYVALMGFVVITRHAALRTHAFDLGQYLQIIWNISRGHGPASTIVPTYVVPDRMHAWGDHFSPIFYALAPLQWLAPGALSVLLAQTVALALGAVALFAFARRVVGEGGAAAFALLYLLNPSLQGINVRDIHPAAFAIPLLVTAAWAFDTGRYAWCALALVATLACREDAAVAVVGFAAWLALARRHGRLGACVAVLAVAVLAVDIAWLMPGYLGARHYDHLNRYRHLGDSLGQVLLSIAFRPWRWIAIVLTPAKLVYLAAMLAPLGFLPLLGGWSLLSVLPGLAMNLLSVDPKLINYQAQYQAFVLPFLLFAAVDGYARLQRLADDRPLTAGSPPRLPAVLARHRAASALGAAFVLATILTSRIVNDLGVNFWRLDDSHRAAHRLMSLIPRDAPVAAYERLVPHLATRRDVWVPPRGLAEAHYVLVRTTDPVTIGPEFERIAQDNIWTLSRRR